MRNILYFILGCLLIGACSQSKSNETSDSTSVSDTSLVKEDTVIQRTILGLTLAETSTDSALSIMRDMGYNMNRANQNDYYILKGIRFAGEQWNALFLSFYKNKLCRIRFVQEAPDKSTYEAHFREINEILKEKYRPLDMDTTTNNTSCGYASYMDDNSVVSMSFTEFGNSMGLYLQYEDIVLYDALCQEGYNEM